MTTLILLLASFAACSWRWRTRARQGIVRTLVGAGWLVHLALAVIANGGAPPYAAAVTVPAALFVAAGLHDLLASRPVVPPADEQAGTT